MSNIQGGNMFGKKAEPNMLDLTIPSEEKNIQIPLYDAHDQSPVKDKRFLSSRDHSVKLGEIKSQNQTPGGSQKIIELHLLKSTRSIQKEAENIINNPHPKNQINSNPNNNENNNQNEESLDSFENHEKSVNAISNLNKAQNQKNINFELISLPDKKDLCGS
jgi:hypothetical protein